MAVHLITDGKISLLRKRIKFAAEQRVLRTFRQFLITLGQMLCFYGLNLELSKAALELLID